VVEQPESRPTAEVTPKRPAPAVAASGNWFIQLAAFSTKPRADALAKRAGARVDGAGSLFRVRFGPYRSEAEAKEALRSIHAKGYPEARILSGG
jgi:rare lipoprotein A